MAAVHDCGIAVEGPHRQMQGVKPTQSGHRRACKGAHPQRRARWPRRLSPRLGCAPAACPLPAASVRCVGSVAWLAPSMCCRSPLLPSMGLEAPGGVAPGGTQSSTCAGVREARGVLLAILARRAGGREPHRRCWVRACVGMGHQSQPLGRRGVPAEAMGAACAAARPDAAGRRLRRALAGAAVPPTSWAVSMRWSKW